VTEAGSQKLFGGSLPSVGFAQLVSNAGPSGAVFGSISAFGSQKLSASATSIPTAAEISSVFGSGTKEKIGFADLVARSGSGVSGFDKKSGQLLTYYPVYCVFS